MAAGAALKSTASQGIPLITWTNHFSGRRPNRPPFVFFLFWWGPVPCCLPSPSLPTTPRPRLLTRLTLVVRMARAHACDAWETTNRRNVQGCCVHPCFTAPLVRSLLAPEQPYNNNDTFDKHRDMTTRWPLTCARRAAHALVALRSAFCDHVVQ